MLILQLLLLPNSIFPLNFFFVLILFSTFAHHSVCPHKNSWNNVIPLKLIMILVLDILLRGIKISNYFYLNWYKEFEIISAHYRNKYKSSWSNSHKTKNVFPIFVHKIISSECVLKAQNHLMAYKTWFVIGGNMFSNTFRVSPI